MQLAYAFAVLSFIGLACSTTPREEALARLWAKPVSELSCDERHQLMIEVRPDMAATELERSYVKCRLYFEFQDFVEARQACSEPSDCTTVDTYCPFGQGVVVNRAEAQAVLQKFQEVYARAKTDCKYSGSSVGQATCIANRCVSSTH